eukprot:Gb_33287 [translate_table: standard]
MARLVLNSALLIILVCFAVNYGVCASSKVETSFESGICNVGTRTSRRILDITHAYRKDLAVGDPTEGLGEYVTLVASMKNGSLFNSSKMKMGVHTGTHVDSPAHFYQEYYEAGLDVDTLDLETLNVDAWMVKDDLHDSLRSSERQ